MEILTASWTDASGWDTPQCPEAQLVLYFAAPKALAAIDPWTALHGCYPKAHVVGCSTGGEILGMDVHDDSVAALVVRFSSSQVRVASSAVAVGSDTAGEALANALMAPDLRAVFMLSDGLATNGSDLITGARRVLPESIVLTGGLAGDGADFRTTSVGCDGSPQSGQAVAIGFYGADLRVGCGSFGGWEPFGPERIITRSDANVLAELDGAPALELYKRYLGDEATRLPGSALLFPLTIWPPGASRENAIVRTIVGVDEAAQTMTFAGDVPNGWTAQLMRGPFDSLVDGASQAGLTAAVDGPSLAILVSCIGRKLLMGQRINDEVEAAAESLGANAVLAGFYSYGEIAPHGFSGRCELHNQTMTITAIAEI
jgi:hypothetical protein